MFRLFLILCMAIMAQKTPASELSFFTAEPAEEESIADPDACYGPQEQGFPMTEASLSLCCQFRAYQHLPEPVLSPEAQKGFREISLLLEQQLAGLSSFRTAQEADSEEEERTQAELILFIMACFWERFYFIPYHASCVSLQSAGILPEAYKKLCHNQSIAAILEGRCSAEQSVPEQIRWQLNALTRRCNGVLFHAISEKEDHPYHNRCYQMILRSVRKKLISQLRAERAENGLSSALNLKQKILSPFRPQREQSSGFIKEVLRVYKMAEEELFSSFISNIDDIRTLLSQFLRQDVRNMHHSIKELQAVCCSSAETKAKKTEPQTEGQDQVY
ncbi:MAG: hypothetical protein H6618_03920 [Deltaproteobacteria bacterium]|nr:hypothetical protein [Deltaproteobacteria bacterium]